jgi:hypothetical protein
MRITLTHHLGYLTALTDSGTADHEGRHVFFQEDWIQRGMVVLRTRWRVGVETKTGQHVLIKQYPTRELHGVIDELYQAIPNDYLPELESLEE